MRPFVKDMVPLACLAIALATSSVLGAGKLKSSGDSRGHAQSSSLLLSSKSSNHASKLIQTPLGCTSAGKCFRVVEHIDGVQYHKSWRMCGRSGGRLAHFESYDDFMAFQGLVREAALPPCQNRATNGGCHYWVGIKSISDHSPQSYRTVDHVMDRVGKLVETNWSNFTSYVTKSDPSHENMFLNLDTTDPIKFGAEENSASSTGYICMKTGEEPRENQDWRECSAWGDPHWTSFDGARFDPQEPVGTEFIAAASLKLNYMFGVYITTTPARWNSSYTLINSVEVDVANQTISMDAYGNLMVNGAITFAPWSMKSANISVEQLQNNSYNIKVDDILLVQFSVADREHPLRILVAYDTYFNTSMRGICGNFDGDPYNDYPCYDGSNNDMDHCWEHHIVPIPSKNDTNSIPYCDAYLYDKANDSCSPITDMDGPFKKCPPDLKDEYFHGCVYDICAAGTPDIVCDELQSFADACIQKISEIINWRTPYFCPLTCSSNMEFDPCGLLATCGDPEPDPNLNDCQGMCRCPNGTLYDNGKCIDPSFCGCQDDSGYHHRGDTWVTADCTQVCTCSQAENGSTPNCVVNTCSPNSQCQLKDGRYGCFCNQGYWGDGKNCAADPCGGHGDYSCQCHLGYTGPDCETEIDWCAQPVLGVAGSDTIASLCQPHGNCISNVTGASCVCNPGFTGKYCEEEIKNMTIISVRCTYDLNTHTENGCSDGQHCMPDNLDCFYRANLSPCSGWCLPLDSNSFLSMVSHMRKRRITSLEDAIVHAEHL